MLEMLPSEIYFNICNKLDSESFFILHSINRENFRICSNYVRHSKKASENRIRENYRELLDSESFKEVPNRYKKQTSHIYLKDHFFDEGLSCTKSFCCAIQTNVLSTDEIARLIGHYKHFLSYQFFGAVDYYGFFKPTIHVNFSLLKPFYEKKEHKLPDNPKSARFAKSQHLL